MNAEKELLLALLIEKYTIKVVQPAKPRPVPKRIYHRKHKAHMWSSSEKKRLLYLREIEHLSFAEIGKILNLRTVQVSATYNSMTRAERKAKVQVQNVL